jgi:RNA polymerase sigma-70 factor (ECF subfamily)
MQETRLGGDAREFPPTRWTLILSSRGDAERQRAALGDLLAAYWKPLYAYARHLKLANEAARDLVQAFCARAIETDLLARFDPSRGRLRTWLRMCFHSYFLDTMDTQRTLKRGGGAKGLPVEAALDVSSRRPRTPPGRPRRRPRRPRTPPG